MRKKPKMEGLDKTSFLVTPGLSPVARTSGSWFGQSTSSLCSVVFEEQ